MPPREDRESTPHLTLVAGEATRTLALEVVLAVTSVATLPTVGTRPTVARPRGGALSDVGRLLTTGQQLYGLVVDAQLADAADEAGVDADAVADSHQLAVHAAQVQRGLQVQAPRAARRFALHFLTCAHRQTGDRHRRPSDKITGV